MFSVIDTPGLDFIEGRELKLERQVTSILRYVDAKYADTMSEVRDCVYCGDHLLNILCRNLKSLGKVKETNISICAYLQWPFA